MVTLIITDTHNNRGEVVDVQFTDHARFYSDEQGRLYTINDFVEVESIDHEQAKAEKLIEYFTVVSQTIREFREKEAKDERI